MRSAVLALLVLSTGYASVAATPEEGKASPLPDDGSSKQPMSLDDAIALRQGQTRVYLERNAMAPEMGEQMVTTEERVTAVLPQPDGSRAFVIEKHTLKSESQDPVTKKWRKGKTTAEKPDAVGSRSGYLASGQRLADWYEGSARQVFIAEFPATEGGSFATATRSGKVDHWKWSKIADIKTQAGSFRDCFAASYDGVTGTKMRRTWCPGVGLVEILLTSAKGGEVRTELVSFRGPGLAK